MLTCSHGKCTARARLNARAARGGAAGALRRMRLRRDRALAKHGVLARSLPHSIARSKSIPLSSVLVCDGAVFSPPLSLPLCLTLALPRSLVIPISNSLRWRFLFSSPRFGRHCCSPSPVLFIAALFPFHIAIASLSHCRLLSFSLHQSICAAFLFAVYSPHLLLLFFPFSPCPLSLSLFLTVWFLQVAFVNHTESVLCHLCIGAPPTTPPAPSVALLFAQAPFFSRR